MTDAVLTPFAFLGSVYGSFRKIYFNPAVETSSEFVVKIAQLQPQVIIMLVGLESATAILKSVSSMSLFSLHSQAYDRRLINDGYTWIVVSAGLSRSSLNFVEVGSRFFLLEFSLDSQAQSFFRKSALGTAVSDDYVLFHDSIQMAAAFVQDRYCPASTTDANGNASTEPKQYIGSRSYYSSVPLKEFQYKMVFIDVNSNPVNRIFQFTMSFSWQVWLTLFFAILAYALTLWSIGYLTPSDQESFAILDCFYYTLGCLFQGTNVQFPDRIAIKALLLVWWFVCILLVVIYVANYGAQLTAASTSQTLQTIDQLLAQNTYQFGFQTGGTLEAILRSSSLTTLQQIYRIATQVFSNATFKTETEFIDRVRNGAFVYLTNEERADYLKKQNCFSVSPGFFESFYQLKLASNTPYGGVIDEAILSLSPAKSLKSLSQKLVVLQRFIDSFRYTTTDAQNICDSDSAINRLVKLMSRDFLLLSPNSMPIAGISGIIFICLLGVGVTYVVLGLEFFVQFIKVSLHEATAQ
ncbi:hypothetical protein Ciccas_001563 [Cichlidogyrus casuarinus]|uniref:Ionotropic glutamate receptor C-terminal domain-containing protein n=1 Tax=Cichlidogyrus casuarinus TaxID=1844966 RepID=A0ABD2QJQ7_9PLAT